MGEFQGNREKDRAPADLDVIVDAVEHQRLVADKHPYRPSGYLALFSTGTALDPAPLSPGPMTANHRHDPTQRET